MKSNSRVAIVTGSSKGIGFSIAETLAHKNVKILLISRKKKKEDMKIGIKTDIEIEL